MVTWTDDAPRAILHDDGVEETLEATRGSKDLTRAIAHDDVYGSLRCLVYYVLLPALFTLALLVAAGVWWLVGRLP